MQKTTILFSSHSLTYMHIDTYRYTHRIKFSLHTTLKQWCSSSIHSITGICGARNSSDIFYGSRAASKRLQSIKLQCYLSNWQWPIIMKGKQAAEIRKIFAEKLINFGVVWEQIFAFAGIKWRQNIFVTNFKGLISSWRRRTTSGFYNTIWTLTKIKLI